MGNEQRSKLPCNFFAGVFSKVRRVNLHSPTRYGGPASGNPVGRCNPRQREGGRENGVVSHDFPGTPQASDSEKPRGGATRNPSITGRKRSHRRHPKSRVWTRIPEASGSSLPTPGGRSAFSASWSYRAWGDDGQRNGRGCSPRGEDGRCGRQGRKLRRGHKFDYLFLNLSTTLLRGLRP